MCNWCGDETHSDCHLCCLCQEEADVDELGYE